VPANINIVRSMRGASARRIALGSPLLEARIRALQQELERRGSSAVARTARMRGLREEIAALRARIDRIPFIDPSTCATTTASRSPAPPPRR
jgi:uncharacterized sporulation protein YeaH/YhbH (DUF444 family)